MKESNHERFAAANDVLRGFLRRLTSEANALESVSEGDLQSVSKQISEPPSEIGAASRGAALDEYLQREIAEYVRNFRDLQTTLDKMHLWMRARKLSSAR